MTNADGELPPILSRKSLREPSVFDPKALLREARRQKGLAARDVPPVCILDPDGDIVRYLKASGEARIFAISVPDTRANGWKHLQVKRILTGNIRRV